MTATTQAALPRRSPSLAADPPLAVYDAALRCAAAGLRFSVTVTDSWGRSRELPPDLWCDAAIHGDSGLLSRCAGAVLDVGCGPGRLTGQAAGRGHDALGIDISPTAIRLARRRGIQALRRDVFGPLPREGGWQRVLLADGNIGIGGFGYFVDAGNWPRRTDGFLSNATRPERRPGTGTYASPRGRP